MDEKKSKQDDPVIHGRIVGSPEGYTGVPAGEVVTVGMGAMMTLARGTDGKGWKVIAEKEDWQLVHFSPEGFLRLEHIHDDGWAHGVYHKTGLCMKCNKEAPQELQAMWLVGK